MPSQYEEVVKMKMHVVQAMNFIRGEFFPGSGVEEKNFNPAVPDQLVTTYRSATTSDIDAALQSALEAQSAWSDLGIIKRGLILRNVANVMEEQRDVLSVMMTREQGKTLAESIGEIDGSIETIRYHAESARHAYGRTYVSSSPGEKIETVRQPLGVVAIITPWNFPTQIPSWKIAPALLWGNTIVWKPASAVTGLSTLFSKIFAEAGVPAGVLNMVLAPGSVAKTLTQSPLISGISFTGSVPVGEQIAQHASINGIKIQLELGGNNAAIVMPDVDLAHAASQLLIGGMSGTGQKCTATRRIITVGSAHEGFIREMKTLIEALVVGDGMNPTTTTGPVISAASQEEILSAVSDALSEGGVLIAQAAVPHRSGNWVAPTLIEGSMKLRTCREEVFGPVTTVMNVDSLATAIEIANSTEFGLTASIFSSREEDIAQAVSALNAGLIKINAPNTGSELHVPFGGLKASTFPGPREQNSESVADFYTVTKNVYRRLPVTKGSK